MRRRTVTRWRIHPISPNLSVPPPPRLPPSPPLIFYKLEELLSAQQDEKVARRRQAADQRAAFPPTLKSDSSPLAGEQELWCVADAEEQQIKIKNKLISSSLLGGRCCACSYDVEALERRPPGGPPHRGVATSRRLLNPSASSLSSLIFHCWILLISPFLLRDEFVHRRRSSAAAPTLS